MPPLPFYCRLWFGPILIGASTGIGTSLFAVLHTFDPVAELDFWFYPLLYSGIGAVAGLAAWYFARLVAERRASWIAIAFVLLPAYLLVASLALDKNPIVAAIATFIVTAILALMWLADHSTRGNRTA